MQGKYAQSERNLSRYRTSFKIAMLRAYCNEPLMRYVAFCDDGSVMVRNERSHRAWLTDGIGEHDWLGWSRLDVYEYDEAVFGKLQRLYLQEEKEKLRQEWARCRLLEPVPATHN